MNRLKHLLLFIFIITQIIPNHSCAQNGQWEWVKGSNSININGVYGTIGVPASTNNPGSRENAQYWTDNNGKFWLFGGYGYGASGGIGRLNDLWKYDPLTNEWTWMKGPTAIDQYGIYGTQGIAAAGNNPGARADAVTWVDANNNLWMLAGFGWPASGPIGFLNDLWKYNTTTNEWTWMKGTNIINQNGIYGTQGIAAAGNNPGGRFGGIGWTDANGNLYTFSTYGFPAVGSEGYLNDLWRYNIANNQWTWMKGSNAINPNGTYGTQGIAAAGNNPGGRHFGIAWKDASGKFWTHGGYGYPAAGGNGSLNDLWKYDPLTNEWTWMKGSNLTNQNGTYGTLGTPAAGNNPGSRYRSISWTDASNTLWLLGGNGFPASGGSGLLNDQWAFNIATNNWTWVHGSNLINQNGTYGTFNVPAPANISGGRMFASGWTDVCGNLWLFSGQGYPQSGGVGNLNDLWKYNNIAVPINPINTTAAPNLTLCSGNTTTLSAISTGTIYWYATPSSTTVLGTGNSFVTPTLAAGNPTFYAEANTCTNSAARTPITLTVNPTPTIAINSGSICNGQSFTLSASGASTYTYQGGNTVVSPTTNTSYTVTGTSSLGCVSATPAVSNITVNALPNITINSGSICSGQSFTLNPGGANTYTISGGLSIVSPTITSSYSVTGTSSAGCAGSNTAVANVTVEALPVISVNSGTICYGKSFTMTPSGAASYTYSGGFAVVSPTINTSYSVTGTSSVGCISATPAISNVSIVSLPVISVNSGSICIGQTFTMNPSGASTYTYSSGNAVVSPTSNTSYSVTGTSSVGCANLTPVICNVTVNPLPTLTVTTSGSVICRGESATLTANGANTYSWTFGGILYFEIVTPTVSTIYTVTGTDGNGCSSSVSIIQYVDLCTRVDENTDRNNIISVYPNPASSSFYVHVNKTIRMKFYLYDQLGREIMISDIDEGVNEIKVSEFLNGIYYFKIENEGSLYKKGKFILEK